MVVAVIDQWRGRAFEWGVNDCARFADDAVLAMTGKRALREGELVFGSSEELVKFSGGNVALVFRKALRRAGLKSVPAPLGQAIAIVNVGKIPALAVWDGGSLWMVSKNGLREIEPLLASEWWEGTL